MSTFVNSANASFSTREREIADLLARGLTEKEIASKLHISPATVNNHTRNIREKFGLTKNTEIVLLYIAEHNKKRFNLSMIREYGISVILVLLNVCHITEIS
ncbi:MAG: helix-turn-helix transcriptional regulator [Rikenellaceae bacterium]|nr:helix-turn-helix transcriptional regulator [Rikenellaceae bacterium]MBQ5371465.1 helix-turn-helix transcriptional regulator [Rikenellaceae bacterium]MBQ5853342.1 helix-turn-helix transcriptional regulator [Rikenellaceae bacterium]